MTFHTPRRTKAPSVSQLLAEITLENQQLRRDRDEWAMSVADRRMRTLISYAVEVWGPESDVDPEADNGSMRADLETFLDAADAEAGS